MSAAVALRPTLAPSTSQIDAIPAAWNRMASEVGNPTIRAMPPARRAKLILRIREFGFEAVMEAICAVAASPFCTGDNNRGWRADFDFLLQPQSLLRLLEGRYAAREPTTAPSYRSGGLGLLMQDAAPGEDAAAVYRRKMDDLNARAEGSLIDHDPTEGQGLFAELPAGGSSLVRPPLTVNGPAAGPERHARVSGGVGRSGGPRAIGDVLAGL
jgi:hypothetical protein